MIKVKVIETFTLEDYKKLKNVEKVQKRKDNEFGVKDTFECDKDMAEYLTGKNEFNKIVVKVIEVIPEKETIYNSTTTYRNDVPITQGLDVVTEYKTTKSTKKKKSSKK